MQTKICTKCDEEKPLDQFSKQKRGKCGRTSRCKSCEAERGRVYEKENRDRVNARKRSYYANNKDTLKAYKESWKEENLDAVRCSQKKHYETNKEKFRERERIAAKTNPEKFAAKEAKRRASKLRRTPAWSEEDLIALVYEQCERLNELWGTNFEVDHFIPLQGEDVSGLHCWDNLQLLDRSLNASKNNRNPLCPTHS